MNMAKTKGTKMKSSILSPNKTMGMAIMRSKRFVNRRLSIEKKLIAVGFFESPEFTQERDNDWSTVQGK